MLRFGNPYSLDGVNNSIYILAEAFIKLGHEPMVIGGFTDDTGKERLRKVFDVEKVPEVQALTKSSNRLALWTAWLRNGTKLIIDLEPDIVISNGVIPVPNVGFRILRIHDVPESLHQRLATKWLLGRYHYCVFSSSIIRDRFLVHFRTNKDKCLVIPLPINLVLYRVRPLSGREHAILFVDGRGRRNLRFALEVFKHVYQYDSDVVMYVVGVKEISSRDWPRSRVIPLGFIGRRELRELYSRVRLLLIPSTYEGFGYPVLEAFASGTPVVGSDAIPPELLVNSFNGFRVHSFKAKVYANAVLKLLGDNVLWTEMSLNALETVRRHDAIIIARKYLELYEKYKCCTKC